MQSLANKYRPRKLEDVCEQNITVSIINRLIETKSLPNALGFFGASGCGKTTVARIVANMINDNKGHPIEINAASNNSVDDVRQIIDNSNKRSLDSEYKVYIIDECHSISNQGWQTFLKLLEEPNKYTIFIFCTTNPEKIPDTVISRMQTFTFTKISDAMILNRLKYICSCENITLDDNSLNYIARISNGSMRQSITNLEKSVSQKNNPSYDDVVNIVGSSDYITFYYLLESIFNRDVNTCISTVEKVYRSGKELKLFIFEFLKYVLDLSKTNIFNGDLSITNLPNVDVITNSFKYNSIFVPLTVALSKFYESCRQQSEVRFLFESKLIEWCYNEINWTE